MNYSDNTSVVHEVCTEAVAQEENLQQMFCRSMELSTVILRYTEEIRRTLFGEWPAKEGKDREPRCFTDVLVLQIATSEEAASQLKFIAERLGV